MKKLLFFLSLLFYASNSFAENSYAEHALMVHRLSYWAPDYLTVTNNWNNMFFSNAPSTLKSLSVITEIDGQSTKDMEPEDFYAIIDNETSFTITYSTKIRGENKTYTQTLTPKKGKLLLYDVSGEYIIYPSNDDDEWYYNYHDTEQRGYGTYAVGLTPKEETSIMADQNVDFSKFNTFDYMVAGDDYSVDLGLLQSISKELERKGLKYNPDNPDIYLYLTKDSHSNIESIYVPNIVSTTRTTSTTIGHLHVYYGNYNSWGSGRSSTIENSTTNTQDRGHTKAFVDADLYLQLSILDAKKMDRTNPPVVWQMVHNRHFIKETNIIEWAKRLHVAVYSYPLSSQKIGRRIRTWGIFFQNYLSNSGVVSDIVNNGWGDMHGIRRGNSLKQVKSDGKPKKNWGTFVPGKGKEPGESFIWNRYWDNTVTFDNVKVDNISRNEIECRYYFIPESEID